MPNYFVLRPDSCIYYYLMRSIHRSVSSVLIISWFLLTGSSPLPAQSQTPVPVIAVLTTLTVKSDVDRSQVMKVLPEEVRATVKLYLDGKIQQWFSRADGKGVIFVMSCTTVADAKALTDTLPLSKANLANFEYTPLTPLGPLRLLIAEPAKSN